MQIGIWRGADWLLLKIRTWVHYFAINLNLGALFAHLGLICCTQPLINAKNLYFCIVFGQKFRFLSQVQNCV